ncbi:MAG: hypothetical protein HYY49_08160 [Ignavibacteriales bacterium]|nr:hypothetical protein [Ignavibacteriales bacterium]
MRRSLAVASFLVAAVVFSAVAQDRVVPVSGGTGRTAALGGGPNNPYIMDYSDVFVNPANAGRYTSLLYSDIGYTFTAYNAAAQYVGYTMSLGDLSIGLAVGRREGPMFPELSYGQAAASFYSASDYMKPPLDGWGPLPGGFGVTAVPLAPIQLYLATNLGGFSVGGALYRSSWSREENKTGVAGGTTNRVMTRHSQTGLKAGVLLDLSSGMSLDASILFRLNGSRGEWSDDAPGANPNSATYDVTGTEIGLNGRMFLRMSDRVQVIPMVRFLTFGYKPSQTDNTTPQPAVVNSTPNDYGRTDLEVGVGIHNTFENGFVVAGASFQQIRLSNDVTSIVAGALSTTKNTQTQTDLPKFNFGAEIGLLEWLVGRFGYFKRFTSTSSKSEPPSPGVTSESTTSSEPAFIPTLGRTAADQQLAVGLGIRVSRVSLDGYVGERFLAAGPFILSGNAQDLFGVLSMSFRF